VGFATDRHNRPIDSDDTQVKWRPDARALEIYARAENETGFRPGTGYLLNNGLVLTAAHVLPGDVAEILMCFPGGRRWRCSVLWCRYDSKDNNKDDNGGRPRVDAALLRVTDPAWTEPPDLPWISWGRLVTGQKAVPVSLTGFPTGMDARDADGKLRFHDVAHAAGAVDTRVRPDGRLLVTLNHPIPAAQGQDLRWKGVSGAAALVSGAVVGLVVTEPKPGGRFLEIMPVTDLAADAGFRAWTGPIAYSPAELRPVLLPDGPRHAYSPVSLLSAEAEAVEFHGRDDLVGELTEWCRQPDVFSVRLVTGAGGEGKTRLARQLVSAMADGDWSAGFLADHLDAVQLSVLGHVTTPLLLAVDYAEDRVGQLVELAALLRAALSGSARAPIRLLLLARADGEWWDRVRRDAPLLREPSPRTVIPLAELEPTPAARHTALRAAIENLGTRLGEVVGFTDVDPATVHAIELPDVSTDRFGRALNLHMTALVTLLQAVDPVDTGKDEDDEAILLRHEQKFWKRTATAFGLGDLGLAARRRLVGVATLCQAGDHAEALAVLDRLDAPEARTPDARDRVTRWLASLYPATTTFWGALQPDRVGEYLVSVVNDKFPDLLGRVLPGAPRAQASRALRTLARADIHRPGMAATLRGLIVDHADPLALAAVDAATTVEHPEPLRVALTAVTHGEMTDTDVLSRLYEEIPLQTQALRQWATEFAERLTVRARAAVHAGGRAELARRLNNYATRLTTAGQHRDTVEAARESVALRHELGKAGDTAALHELALSVNSYANALTDLGELPQALEVAEDLVDLCRKTADFDPADLAMALYSLSTRQGDMGRLAEAVSSVEEALRLYQELADDDPAYLPDVAMALNGRAIALRESGRYDLAVDAAAQAVDLYRTLAADAPDAYLEDVAHALDSQASAMVSLGDGDEAVLLAAESVRLRQKLMAAVPNTDPTRLTEALTTYARCLSQTDRDEEALTAFTEVLDIDRERYAFEPRVYRAQYARALSNHAMALQSLGRDEEALPLYNEIRRLYLPLVESMPEAYGDELRDVMSNLAMCLVAREELPRALEAMAEAETLGRALAAEEPETHLPTLLETLHEHTTTLSEAGFRTAAVILAEKLVGAAREGDAEEYAPQLAQALTTYAIMLSDAGRADEILPVAEEAHGIWQRLADGDPERFRSDLGVALHVLAVGLSQVGDHDAMLDVSARHVRLYEVPARSDPPAHVLEYFRAMTDQVIVLTEIGRAAEALEASEPALDLGTGSDDVSVSDLAELLGARAQALAMRGRHDEAIADAESSLAIWRDLAGDDPAEHQPGFAAMLRVHAEILAAAGHRTEAGAAADQAVVLFRELAMKDSSAFAHEVEKALATRSRL
jgi:tetratricopeptide (TPR) repeat protein